MITNGHVGGYQDNLGVMVHCFSYSFVPVFLYYRARNAMDASTLTVCPGSRLTRSILAYHRTAYLLLANGNIPKQSKKSFK